MKKLNNEEFINKAEKAHPYPDDYGYDRVNYANWKTPVEIYCPRCKEYFWQLPSNHLRGRGCKKCGCKKLSKSKTLTKEEVENRITQIHPEGFEYLSDYKSMKDKLIIKCLKCGKIFKQTAEKHLKGNGCPYCTMKKLKTFEQFTKDSNKVHGVGSFCYDDFEYKGNRKKGKIKCLKCNKYFWQSPTNHLRGEGCPYCCESKGEKAIQKTLIENNIKFEQQKRFKDCKDKRTLPFDFYLPDYNTCIEYQGQQHYTPAMQIHRSKTKEEGIQKFNLQKYHDKIKRKYCKKKGIKLLEIRYFDDIKKILTDLIKENKSDIIKT